MDKYTLWLDKLVGVGKQAKFLLWKNLGSPEEIFRADQKRIESIIGEEKTTRLLAQRSVPELEKQYEYFLTQDMRLVHFFDESFPERLRMIPDPPLVLYYIGRLPKETTLSVAIIGARECSEYGKYVAKELGKYLGKMGVDIISGMARGVDGISQMAALDAGGRSYGVLGSSADRCYPKENKALYERLKTQGGVLSIYPPVTEAKAQLFPPRNRIVSGLADVLVVVEARQKSGTLITVDMALEQGKEVYVVPGRVTDRLSDGCNQLVRDGANVFLSPADLLEQMKKNYPEKCESLIRQEEQEEREPDEPNFENDLERDIYRLLDFYPQNIERLKLALKERKGDNWYRKEQGNIVGALMKMCMRDVAKQLSPGWFQKEKK